ncbi:N-acetyl-gamma-glutamyl-phosphate reductase [Pseudogemmatithrix spongiicola]|uniref:N-acetyl-gamma-glutamyl-phosphate reductase n=1 Tax=Pseudogemmatithrix spongiicola TaxID=3062599 RepID=A0AA49Q680_9BACT|nr:N-acetyl-gamma-glutamyl-phosphate reductase [Gemmatimonadaceae bacterium 'strain 138']WKW13737.1 N-acetyl-gamma-glutamyl-phosphate reductase [Gemmatimonadaceae bacterium 'strain 318']
MHKIPVGVLGASGYAGRELSAFIAQHPRLTLAFATANAQRGETLELPGGAVTFIATDDAPLASAELVFSSLPHGASAEWVARARAAGARVVDLSTDLRIGNGAAEAVPYGLTEWTREAVRSARVVANPGCYPTSALLALLPLLERDLIASGATVSISSASGVTGAGLSPRLDLLFGEVTENYRAYGVGNSHRHLNEMRAAVQLLARDVDLLFTPHLLPIARGILSTITVPLRAPLADPLEPWRTRYAGEPFIEVVDALPELRQVQRRNVARIAVRRVEHVRTPTLQIFSAIDNLVKGAAGQALQNANLMLGLDETLGLPR